VDISPVVTFQSRGQGCVKNDLLTFEPSLSKLSKPSNVHMCFYQCCSYFGWLQKASKNCMHYCFITSTSPVHLTMFFFCFFSYLKLLDSETGEKQEATQFQLIFLETPTIINHTLRLYNCACANIEVGVAAAAMVWR